MQVVSDQQHEKIEREEPFEVRDYQSYVVAETFVDCSFNAVGNEGFQRLFRFISGENRAAVKSTMMAPVEQEAASAKIAMTAPVEQQRAGARWRIAFVLPPSYTLANAPRPTDDRVVLAEAPPRRMAIVRYRGTWSEARYGKELAVLRRFIGERGLTAVGEPVLRATIRHSCRGSYAVMRSRSRCKAPLRADANPPEPAATRKPVSTAHVIHGGVNELAPGIHPRSPLLGIEPP